MGKLAARDLGALRAYRARAGWKLLPDRDGSFWLCVPAGDDELFRKLPLTGRWTAVDGGKIVREGKRVPDAWMPEGPWQPVHALLPIAPPARGAPGMPPSAVSFDLIPDDAGLSAEALMCRWDAFAGWAESAFEPRFSTLQFARSDDDRAFVTGQPLPAIPGSGFHPVGRLWLPCGYRLPDHVWPELLEEALGLGGNRFAILHADGSHEEMDHGNLVPATRAAVRITAREEPMLP